MTVHTYSRTPGRHIVYENAENALCGYAVFPDEYGGNYVHWKTIWDDCECPRCIYLYMAWLLELIMKASEENTP